jgi:hypothetical protein
VNIAEINLSLSLLPYIAPLDVEIQDVVLKRLTRVDRDDMISADRCVRISYCMRIHGERADPRPREEVG